MTIEPIFTDVIDLQLIPDRSIHHYWLKITSDPLGNNVNIPVIIAKGNSEGPVFGITSAVHGDELNGIPVVQQLFKEIDVTKLNGTIIGIPAVNIPSLFRKKRRFIDGTDLNHIFPGKPDGNVSQIYVYRFFEKIVKNMNYLIDLHTASFGRINSFYIRADMLSDKAAKLAEMQNPQIIVHNPPSDGTLRGAADAIDIHAITLELGNPNRFQKEMIDSGITGIKNCLSFFDMYDVEIVNPISKPILCKNSYWLYTTKGGILNVLPEVTDLVKKGDVVATLDDIFGKEIDVYKAPEDGIVIGKSVSPINQSGGRILHLGIFE